MALNAVPAGAAGEPDGQAAAAADAPVATVSAPAAAAMMSLFRFRVMVRSRDKVALRLIARAAEARSATFLRPWLPSPPWQAARRWLVDVVRVRAPGRGEGGRHPSWALTKINNAG